MISMPANAPCRAGWVSFGSPGCSRLAWNEVEDHFHLSSQHPQAQCWDYRHKVLHLDLETEFQCTFLKTLPPEFLTPLMWCFGFFPDVSDVGPNCSHFQGCWCSQANSVVALVVGICLLALLRGGCVHKIHSFYSDETFSNYNFLPYMKAQLRTSWAVLEWSRSTNPDSERSGIHQARQLSG